MGVLVTCTGQCLGVIAQMGVLSHMEVGTSTSTCPLIQHHTPDVCVCV